MSAAPALQPEADRPPEARGLARDEVRLMVARRGAPLVHTTFLRLAEQLRPGDLVVVNGSATLPAALPARRADGTALALHLSTPEPPGRDPRRWVVELRRGGARFRGASAGELLELPGGGRARLLAPYLSPGRLWVAALSPAPLDGYLARHGRPIGYAHQAAPPALADLQTMFASEPGSAEMPSAGRPFTPLVVEALRARDVALARIVLHTGVSSLERGERPYPERYAVPASTAVLVNATHAVGGRVVAVGTTVVRALESAAAPDGSVAPAAGWTSLVVEPRRGVRVVDGLLTGWHDPEASHLLLLEAVGGRELIARSYAAALARGYLRHEFGDAHLILR